MHDQHADADRPELLHGWKEIAAELGVTPRTARSWERCHGLPVSRIAGPHGPVRLLRDDLVQWQRARGPERDWPPEPKSAGARWKLVQRWVPVLGTCAGGLVVLALLLWRTPGSHGSAALEPTVRLQLADPPPATFLAPEPSPDLRQCAYLVNSPSGRAIAIVDLDGEGTRTTARGANPTAVAWSSDGDELLYASRSGELWIEPEAGGERLQIAKLPRGRCTGLAFTPDGTRMVVAMAGSGLHEIDRATGSVRRLWEHPHTEDPIYLPTEGSRKILFAAQTDRRQFADTTAAPHEISVLDLDTGAVRRILEIASSVPTLDYHPSGRLIYATGGADNRTIRAVEFDPGKLEVGTEFRTVSDDLTSLRSGAGGGTFGYRGPFPRGSVGWRGRSGGSIETVRSPFIQIAGAMVVGPDGESILAVGRPEPGNRAIWLFSKGDSSSLTSEQLDARSPVWHPDGKRFAFAARRIGEPFRMYTTEIGGREHELLTAGTASEEPFAWSHDGKTLLFGRRTAQGRMELWKRDGALTGGAASARQVADQPGDHWDARFSHDDELIAYGTVLDGKRQVLVRRTDAAPTTAGWLVAEGRQPRWSRNEQEIVFERDRHVHSVRIQRVGKHIEAGQVRRLFALTSTAKFDVTPDGRRFVSAEYGPVGAESSWVTVWAGLPEFRAENARVAGLLERLADVF